MVEELRIEVFKTFEEIIKSESNQTSYQIIKIWGLPESIFHPSCIEAVRIAATEVVGENAIMEMKSGAGHDAAWTSKVVSSSMIFVPSKNGISHNPEEYTSPEDCAIGAQVLLQSVLYYDNEVKQKEESAS